MKGTWVWPESPKAQSRLLRRMDAHEVGMLLALTKSRQLTPFEIEEAADVHNWALFEKIRGLQALGLVAYTPHLFGDFGYYSLTETGKAAAQFLANVKPPS